MKLENICVVLVEPQGPLNIGSVSRAMMNFGISDLRLVNPATNHLNEDARRMAVNATTILEKARRYDDLPKALADCHFSLATTRRLGRYRERILHPEDAATLILPLSASGKTALVFGREDHGLFTKEIDHCQRILTIPTHPDLKSLNLAQSVAISLYHIFASYRSAKSASGKSKKLATGKSVEQMFTHMRDTFLDIGYLDPKNPDHILRTFRSILGRAQLDEREVRILHGLMSKIDWLKEQSEKK